MSNSSIMSVREMIDAAFGEPEVNTVNHKLIQTILFLLARQLRLLERRVEIEIGPISYIKSGSRLSVTELKIHAKNKKKIIKPSIERGTGPTRDTTSRLGTQFATGSAPINISPDKSLSEESSSESMTVGTLENRAPLDKPMYNRKNKKDIDKSSSDKTSSADKTSTDKTSTSADKTSSSADKTSTAITSSDKTTSELTSTDKTSTDKASILTSTDKTSTGISSTDKRSTDKTSSYKTTTDTTSTDKAPSRRSSTGRVTSQKRPTIDIGGTAKRKLEEYQNLLETIEEQKEKELRVIHQRADSFEQPGKTPTPMASLDSVETKYEKLLVVERVPVDESKARSSGRTRTDSRGPVSQLSVVTQEQFEALAETVRQLQRRFDPVATPGFPENAQLMAELRKGASLTDAMAALQLSARLEATEKTLRQLLSIVTDLARKCPDIDLTPIRKDDTNIIFGAKDDVGTGFEVGTGTESAGGKSFSAKEDNAAAKKKKKLKAESHSMKLSVSSQSIEINLAQSLPYQEEQIYVESADENKVIPNHITYDELDQALAELQNELLNKVNTITLRNTTNADTAYKVATRLESKLNAALNLGNRMSELEELISEYAAQMNALDTGLSSQMTNYQELLTQMQHDLETGLETMAEVLANTGGDTAAVAELNSHFTNLQIDFDHMANRQKDLKNNHDSLSLDLQGLWKQIEMLRETKSDREEVADALRDKAGIGALNGLVSLQQFEAVRGDFEKRIGAAYDKFNNQEIVWQKAIDELIRELNEKADLIQVLSLKDEINKHLNILRSRLDAMLEIVGEPKAAAITRKLHRDSACLSCSTPAHMDLEEPGKIAALPAFQAARYSTVGAKDTEKPNGDGDHSLCYPGFPVTHPIDPRSRVCQRYCGGSHTLITNTICRAPPTISTNPVIRKMATGPGTDGKMYMLDEPVKKAPCLPCNIPKTTTARTSIKQEDTYQDDDSDMVPSDFRLISQLTMHTTDNDGTPPPPLEED